MAGAGPGPACGRSSDGVAVTALETASRLGSQRGVHAVTRFRAGLPTDAGPHARDLDDRLDAVYAGATHPPSGTR